MKISTVNLLVFISLITLTPAEDLSPIKLWQNEQIYQMISALNSIPVLFRNYVQPHFDNSVRTLTESLRQFSLAAHLAPFAVAQDNRTAFQYCLSDIRDSVEDALEFLRKKAGSPVFDFSVSTETRIESDMRGQVDELLSLVASKTNETCIWNLQITTNNLYTVYNAYIASLKTCISSISVTTNNQLIARFNPEHFPALSYLNQIRRSLEATKTTAHTSSFLDYYCTPATLKEFTDVKTSAEQVMIEGGQLLDACYNQAKPLIPETNPYIALLQQCDLTK